MAIDSEKEQAVEECKQQGKMCIFSDNLDCFATCIAFPGIILLLIYYFLCSLKINFGPYSFRRLEV